MSDFLRNHQRSDTSNGSVDINQSVTLWCEGRAVIFSGDVVWKVECFRELASEAMRSATLKPVHLTHISSTDVFNRNTFWLTKCKNKERRRRSKPKTRSASCDGEKRKKKRKQIHISLVGRKFFSPEIISSDRGLRCSFCAVTFRCKIRQGD